MSTRTQPALLKMRLLECFPPIGSQDLQRSPVLGGLEKQTANGGKGLCKRPFEASTRDELFQWPGLIEGAPVVHVVTELPVGGQVVRHAWGC